MSETLTQTRLFPPAADATDSIDNFDPALRKKNLREARKRRPKRLPTDSNVPGLFEHNPLNEVESRDNREPSNTR